MVSEVLACIGLGSNQGDRELHIQQAVEAISKIPHCRLDKCSNLYETPAWGLEDQPSFLNAVCGVRSDLPPQDLLAALQRIEASSGRTREIKWGPRTLDLDILCMADLAIDTPTLTLPHPLFKQRRFVLEPLAEIYPDLIIDGLSATQHLGNLVN